MKRLPGVILFLILALVIMQIVTLRVLSGVQKRLDVLEKKVYATQPATPAPIAATDTATAPAKP